MKVCIVDDDPVFAHRLKNALDLVCVKHGFSLKSTIMDAPDDIIQRDVYSKFDIIFLDIDMPIMNGLEIADRINAERDCSELPYIVFVTAHDHLVFEALKKYPYSFVRKSHIDEIELCVLNINKKFIVSPTYTLKSGRDLRQIELRRVIYLEKHGNYVSFYTKDGEVQERATLTPLHKELSAHGFVRPHVGYVVNAACIVEYKKDYIKLTNGKVISISRGYRTSFREEYMEWMVSNRC
ncbi:MAG: response regulator transcription factor [Ruminococcus sp.]|nr:response regulator transcription factor [Ruminococcus sp.]